MHDSRLTASVMLALLLPLHSLSGCAQLPPRAESPPESAAPAADSTKLDRLFMGFEAQRPGQSAFRLLQDGPEAFAVRARSAALADRSIDVQTYIWHGDVTGTYLAHELLQAADRGVQVRLLVDDMDARAKNAGFAALEAHPNIAVRMFNPFASRRGTLQLIGEALRSFRRINHRMHNKSWIADNRIAVVGGRNLGDEYFGASEQVNFIDLDFAMVGPIVRDASASFDRYWNSSAAFPIEQLDAKAVSARALAELRKALADRAAQAANSRYVEVLRAHDSVRRMAAGEWPMEWSGRYQFVADDPLKATLPEEDLQRSQVLTAVTTALAGAHQDLKIISPYFVPGAEGSAALVRSVKNGRRVQILTNSLVANDVAAVHGGYSRHRKSLLEGGVELWELKPLPGGSDNSSLLGSSGASLHTKALVLDDKGVFVGSYNLDPRSTWLNCEQGVFVENTVLAEQLEQTFRDQTAPDHSWRVQLVDDELRWSDGAEQFDSDPKASFSRRFQAWLARVLHLDAQL